MIWYFLEDVEYINERIYKCIQIRIDELIALDMNDK